MQIVISVLSLGFALADLRPAYNLLCWCILIDMLYIECNRLNTGRSGEWLRTCTIITGEPNELVAQIHPRMPVILPAQHHAAWLGETDDGNLKALLLPYPADEMRMWEISAWVNSPKNDDPSLWEPLHAQPTQTTTDALELLRE